MSLKKMSVNDVRVYLDRMADFYQSKLELCKAKNDHAEFMACLEILHNIKSVRLNAHLNQKAAS